VKIRSYISVAVRVRVAKRGDFFCSHSAPEPKWQAAT